MDTSKLFGLAKFLAENCRGTLHGYTPIHGIKTRVVSKMTEADFIRKEAEDVIYRAKIRNHKSMVFRGLRFEDAEGVRGRAELIINAGGSLCSQKVKIADFRPKRIADTESGEQFFSNFAKEIMKSGDVHFVECGSEVWENKN